MMSESQDRRIRKTKTAIHQAVLRLMQGKRLSEISVRELTDLADVNRKTFYNHYDDIYDVLDEMEDECVDRLVSLINLKSLDDVNFYIEHPAAFFSHMITEIHDNEEFYTLMIQSQSHSRISQKLIAREKEMLRTLIPPSRVNELWIDYFLIFISAGMNAVINHWFFTGKQIPIESLAEFFTSLFNAQDVRRFFSTLQQENPIPVQGS